MISVRNLKSEKFSTRFENSVLHTIEKYGLVSRKEKILVACSGGKDSTTLAFILKRHGFEIEALHIDLGLGEYSRNSLRNLAKFCKDNSINLNVVDFRKETGIVLEKALVNCMKHGKSPCSICGTIKKSIMNRKARELGFRKVATGHNLDDECQSLVMNVFRSSPSAASFGPLTKPSEGCGLVPRIKPLFFCMESDVKKYSKLSKLPVSGGICPYSKNVYRREIKNWMDRLENEFPGTKMAIVSNFTSFAKGLCRKTCTRRTCKSCGEASSGETCMACQAMGMAKTLSRNFRKS